MLHFDDGFVRYHKKGEARSNEWVVAEPLNVVQAVALSNYEIKCSDGYYSSPKNPSKVTRKSKGTEYTWLCQTWSQSAGCINTGPDHAKEHWLYLHLPEPLESGKTYTLNTTGIAGNGNEWEINFSPDKNQSEAIHVNLVGYDPRAPKKYGYVYHWSGEAGGIDFAKYNGNNFYLINTKTLEKVYTGTLKFRKDKNNVETYQTDTPQQNFLGADVHECEFSGFNIPGEYLLAVEGIGHSFPFVIKPGALRNAFYTSIRGLYHNRSGIALEEPFTQFTRPAPQHPALSPGFAGKLKYTTSRFVDWINEDHSANDKKAIVDGILGPVDTWGFYQDAGDWDGYFSHMRIPVMLMLTWESAPANFADGELNLPEGKNSIPDILDEARWLIRYFHRTRNELVKKGYGTGGIGARVAPDWFGSEKDGVPSYDDTRQWITSGEDPFTTYFYAGLAAHYALALKKLGVTDPENIDWQKEAEEAWLWAKNNTRTGDTTPSKVLGYNLAYYRFYAAATLFRLTGKAEYENAVVQAGGTIGTVSALEEDQKWGAYSLITGKENVIATPGFMDKIKGGIIATADKKFTGVEQRACRYGGDMWFPMLVGQGTTPMIFEIVMGHFLSKDFAPEKTNSYWSAIFTTADYFLGCNPLNMTYITHVGVRYPERIFHIDSWYSKNGEMIPGVTPYGPWRDQASGTAIGPWDIRWPYKTLFPGDINKWPGHERWYNNYTTPLNAEFTVHQNTVVNASVYGYLCGVADGSFKANNIPSIQISSPAQNAKIAGDINIEVAVADPDGTDDIAWVEYYNDWHKIGQSNKAPYSFT